jgi:hypothetical protein
LRPALRRRQHRDRSGDAGHSRRLYAAAGKRRTPSTPRAYDKLNFDFLRDIMPVGGIDLVPW